VRAHHRDTQGHEKRTHETTPVHLWEYDIEIIFVCMCVQVAHEHTKDFTPEG
jgi:hypothetical protein